MQDEINRWKGLPSTNDFSSPIKVRTLKNVQTRTTKVYVKPLAEILDEFDAEGEMEKKKYMKGGHLNPKVLDDFLQKKSDKPVFGEERMTKDAIIELMEEFDSAIISHGTKSVPTVPKMPKPVVTKLNRAEKPYSNFVPSTERAITKKDHAKVASKIDSIYIKEGRNLAYSDMSGQSKVEAHRSYLNRELQLANCPAKGPDIQRLRIYSELFEIIIKDFRTYNELLAEIKNEYDLVIGNFSQRDEEIIYLRTKIQKLVAQNENRVLLRFEKERCKALEERIKAVEDDNSRLEKDLTYKLHLYAAYLPLSSGEISFAPGQDPITLRDKIIADKDKLLKQRKSEIENLKKTLEEDYVLKSEFVTMESSLNSLIDKHKRLTETNSTLEATISAQSEEINILKSDLSEKDRLYQFLLTEYSEMCSNVASRVSDANAEPI